LLVFSEGRRRQLARLWRSNACRRFLSVVFLVQLQLQRLRLPECDPLRADSSMAATAGVGVALGVADILWYVSR